MNILIIGRNGQLAVELRRLHWPADIRLSAVGRAQLDLCDRAAVREIMHAADPELVINAAAYTAVDRAEAEPERAFAVNHQGPLHLATEAARRNIPLIHISTDYVFNGQGNQPWRETDEPGPRAIYGQSKLEGERAIRSVHPAHVILRTSWLFAAHGHNFVLTMLRLGAERESLGIVDDQVGCPTAAADLAGAIGEIAQALLSGQEVFGTYHYCGKGPVSWFEFAAEIFDCAKAHLPRPPTLKRITTAQFGAPAARPAFSVLDCAKIERDFAIVSRPWLIGLRAVIDELQLSRAVST